MPKILVPNNPDEESLECAYVISKVPQDHINNPKYFYSQFWMNRIRMDHGIEVRPEKWTWKKVYYSYKIYISYTISNREPIIWNPDNIDLDNPFARYHTVPCSELTKSEVAHVIIETKKLLNNILPKPKVNYECVLDQKNKRLMIFFDIDNPLNDNLDVMIALELGNVDMKAFRQKDKVYYVDYVNKLYSGY